MTRQQKAHSMLINLKKQMDRRPYKEPVEAIDKSPRKLGQELFIQGNKKVTSVAKCAEDNSLMNKSFYFNKSKDKPQDPKAKT